VIVRPRTVYVDPGVRYAAWAVFGEDGQLEATGKCARDDFAAVAAKWSCYGVIEEPWGVGEHTTEKDIMQLCLAAGEYGGRFKNTRYERPTSTPKPARHLQALKRLTAAELAVLPKQKTHRKHILCAVWMGLRVNGRMV
jgi:hypothetical protein